MIRGDKTPIAVSTAVLPEPSNDGSSSVRLGMAGSGPTVTNSADAA